mmetsp:Transcript_53517/g.125566  ORF Transcript_53517/g.125566 Transcript_53517/m.125566 type:complete len:80 (+) Transcript_53517:171-410(+)
MFKRRRFQWGILGPLSGNPRALPSTSPAVACTCNLQTTAGFYCAAPSDRKELSGASNCQLCSKVSRLLNAQLSQCLLVP